MYLAIPPHKTCAPAWLSAVMKVNAEPGHEAYNVIIDIADPVMATAEDENIVDVLNTFLEMHDSPPLQTVANTIFPYSLYKRYGAPKFYEIYLERVYPKVKQQEWGRYFERMINCKTEDKSINPLAKLVTTLSLAIHGRLFRNIYELVIYDPALDVRIYDPTRDANRVRNRQCLSFLSFKLSSEKKLSLTAIYRNHFYIARLLGNMIGLGRLLEFVALETGAEIGSLTIVSTHATVDTSPWKRVEIAELIKACIKD
jgi:hypothetical protein